MRKILTTVALVSGLLLPAFAASAADSKAPVRAIILPFKNLSANVEDNWLGESFSETLTMGLAPLRSLQLVERSQISNIMKEQAFSQTGFVDDQSAPQMGKLVGAKIVVLGSYQKVGTELSINARFVDVETGKIDATVTAQVQGPYSDLFKLQKKLADQLIQNLSVTATEQEAKQLEGIMFASKTPQAYEYYIKGKMLSQQGTESAITEAIKWYQKALIEDFDYALAYAGLAEAFAVRGIAKEFFTSYEPTDLTKTMEFAQRAVSLNAALPETHRALGWAYFANKNPNAALETMRKATQMKPGNSEMIAAFMAVKHFDHLPEPDVLKGELLQLGANMDDPWMQLTVVQACAAQARTTSERQHAITAYEDLQKKLPHHFYVPYSLALLYMQMHQTDKAKAAIEQALKIDPDNFLALYASSSILAYSGDTQQAKLALLKIVKQKPDFPWSYLSLIDIYNELNEPDKAMMMYKYGSKYLPNSPRMMMGAARVYKKQKDYQTSQQMFEKALSAAESNTNEVQPALVHEELAELCQEQHQYDKAMGHYQKMSSSKMFKARALQNIAGLYHTQDKPAEALKAYSDYLQQFPDEAQKIESQNTYRKYHLLLQFDKNPQDAQALNDLGQLALANKTPALAEAYLKQALLLSPSNPVIQYNAGCLYLQTRKWTQALAAFEKAVALKPDYTNGWFNLALAHLQLGQTDKAQQSLKKVLALSPQHPQATKVLESLSTKKS